MRRLRVSGAAVRSTNSCHVRLSRHRFATSLGDQQFGQVDEQRYADLEGRELLRFRDREVVAPRQPDAFDETLEAASPATGSAADRSVPELSTRREGVNAAMAGRPQLRGRERGRYSSTTRVPG